ncbi:MAG: hypothetical protein ACRD04_14735, partial [Terriglobales bacterium]
NNFLEGAAENFLIGGAASQLGQDVQDVTFTHNYVFKPLSWDPSDPSYAGTPWSVKNLLELKQGDRVLVEGNVFRNDWSAAQSGRAILIATTDQGTGKEPWVAAENVTVEYNWMDNTQGMAEVSAYGGAPVDSGVASNHIAISENLATNQGNGSGWMFLGVDDIASYAGNPLYSGSGSDVLIAHNTLLLSPSDTSRDDPTDGMEFESLVAAGETPLPNWAIRDNIFPIGRWGIHGTCQVGSASVPCYGPGAWPGNLVYNTAADDCGATAWSIFAASTPQCPVATVDDIGFVGPLTGTLSPADFALLSTSPAKDAASDGSDIGVNITVLQAAIAGVAP